MMHGQTKIMFEPLYIKPYFIIENIFLVI